MIELSVQGWRDADSAWPKPIPRLISFASGAVLRLDDPALRFYATQAGPRTPTNKVPLTLKMLISFSYGVLLRSY